MLTTRIIPCLDVRDGRVVKGVRFQGLRDAGDPAERAAAYEAQGADEIVMLDVSATPDGRATACRTVAAIRRAVGIPLTVGGGVRSVEDASRLLDSGADKVSVNTAAVLRPALLSELAERFGCQCVVLALDAAARSGTDAPDGAPASASGVPRGSPDDRSEDRWETVIRSGRERTGRSAVEWAAQATAHGAGEVLLTSWDRDGTGHGYDLELIGAVSRRVGVPVVASGGAATPVDLVDAVRAGADAVLAASMFHDGACTVAEVKRALREHGVEVRE